MFPRKNGFTLLEVIITLFVVIVGVVAVYIASQQSLFYTQNSISQLTAAYLAQEGIEIVRNIRDTNWLNNRNWDTGLTACEASSGGCEADYGDGSLSPSGATLIPLNLETTGFYGYNSGTPTRFTRRITIGSEPGYLKVIVLVEWKQKGGGPKSIGIQENLYPWWSD